MSATVVSVCNFAIGPEHKPQLNPAHYTVPAASEDNLGILVISNVIQYIPQLDYKTMVLPVPDNEIARSVVDDWVNGQLQVDAESRPGLFWVEGKNDSDDIKDHYAADLANATTLHTNWANNLLHMADDLWEHFHQHRHLSTSMVNAAKFLKADRAWTKQHKPTDLKACIACTTFIPSAAIVCKTCGIINDQERYDELKLKKVG